MSTAVDAVIVDPDKYKKNFDAVVTLLTQYIDKRAPKLSVKVVSVTQSASSRSPFQKSFMDIGGDVWFVIFFMIHIATIRY